MWLINTIWTIGGHLFGPILSNIFDPNCLTFLLRILDLNGRNNGIGILNLHLEFILE